MGEETSWKEEEEFPLRPETLLAREGGRKEKGFGGQAHAPIRPASCSWILSISMGVVTITWQVPAPQPASISLSSVSFFLPKGRERQSEEVAAIQEKPQAHPEQPQNPTRQGCTLSRRAIRAQPSERGMKGDKQLSSCRPHPLSTDSIPTNNGQRPRNRAKQCKLLLSTSPTEAGYAKSGSESGEGSSLWFGTSSPRCLFPACVPKAGTAPNCSCLRDEGWGRLPALQRCAFLCRRAGGTGGTFLPYET